MHAVSSACKNQELRSKCDSSSWHPIFAASYFRDILVSRHPIFATCLFLPRLYFCDITLTLFVNVFGMFCKELSVVSSSYGLSCIGAHDVDCLNKVCVRHLRSSTQHVLYKNQHTPGQCSAKQLPDSSLFSLRIPSSIASPYSGICGHADLTKELLFGTKFGLKQPLTGMFSFMIIAQ